VVAVVVSLDPDAEPDTLAEAEALPDADAVAEPDPDVDVEVDVVVSPLADVEEEEVVDVSPSADIDVETDEDDVSLSESGDGCGDLDREPPTCSPTPASRYPSVTGSTNLRAKKNSGPVVKPVMPHAASTASTKAGSIISATVSLISSSFSREPLASNKPLAKACAKSLAWDTTSVVSF